jgi:hypothetical protein
VRHRAQGSPPSSVAANGEQVDPSNMMPAPNQEPWPGQKAELTTERVASTIPKGDSDANWSYPSPQMFYNGAWRRTARTPPALSPCLSRIANSSFSSVGLMPRHLRVCSVEAQGQG